MAIGPGTRVGPYEVTALVGEGGMGKVWRARHTALKRDDALKVLPDAFAADPERLARFQREAQVLASLNHPNIAHVYGVEQAEDTPALVMEFVDGPTLADRIAAGPIRVDEALSIAKQIVEALDAAHGQNIVHRDLKPANVKVRSDGVTKVLDFGLAKALQPGATSGEAVALETMTNPAMTREGVILGTVAYMSPEQARGQPVDKRTDIWAFGCVLYEMLTGRGAFARATASDTIAAILEHKPDLNALPITVPAHVRHVLERCLEKDPKRRLRDIGDATAELGEAPVGLDIARTPLARRRRVAWVALLGAGGVVALIALPLIRQAGNVEAPPDFARHATFAQLTAEPGIEWFPSLSPDGQWIVYSGGAEGNRDIYLQSVTGQNPINLTRDSSADDEQPAFSPDGQRIAFRSSRDGGGIFVMGRTGEALTRVTREGFRPAWSPDGSRLAYVLDYLDVNPPTARTAGDVFIVDLDSGETRRLMLDRAATHVSWSPNGSHLAVAVREEDVRQMDIWTYPLRGGTPTALVSHAADDWHPVWSPDGRYLYFTSDRTGNQGLWRISVDERSGHARGDPEPVAAPSAFAVHPSISADGRKIAFSSVGITTNIAKLQMDPDTGAARGEPLAVTTGSRPWSSPDPSPDGQWVAFYSRLNPEGHVYVARVDGTGLRRLTGEAAIDRVPRWSPDGNWIAFFSNRSGSPYELWKVRPDGSGLQRITNGGANYPVWSPDGSRIATTPSVLAKPSASRNVVVLDPDRPWADQTPETLPPLGTPPDGFVVNSWSPDRQQLAGQTSLGPTGIATYSFQSGMYRQFTDYGEFPVWLPDSRHILFVAGGSRFLVLDTITSHVRTVFSTNQAVLGPPRLTRDGRTAYFSRRLTESDIWLVTLPSAAQP